MIKPDFHQLIRIEENSMQQEELIFWSAYAAYRAHCEDRGLTPFDASFKHSDVRVLFYLRNDDCAFAQMEQNADGSWDIDLREDSGIRHDTVALTKYMERHKLD
jgi:hypothetical protein